MSHYDRDPSTGNLIQTAGMRSLDEIKAIMLDICYPVGSIYQSTENVSPATFLGGTWISLSGYMLRGATSGVRQATDALDGGADTFTIGTSNMAGHTHGNKSLVGQFQGSDTQFHWNWVSSGIISKISGQHTYMMDRVGNSSGNQAVGFKTDASHTHDNVGSGTAISNLPKYKNVYMWERTA